jgi:hypothetical protein
MIRHSASWLATGTAGLLAVVAVTAQSQPATQRENLVAYTEAFAKRFALEKSEIQLSNGSLFQAVEIVPGRRAVGVVSTSTILVCELRLYVPSSLEIQLPLPGEMGSIELAGSRSHFFIADDIGAKKWQRLGIDDRRHFARRQTAFSQLAVIATPGTKPGTRGSFMTLLCRSFVREVFPQINFLEVGIPCQWVTEFDKKYLEVEIWLKRAGRKDYREIANTFIDPEDFIRLHIPPELMRRAKPVLEATQRAK